jgi:hypothetical protein
MSNLTSSGTPYCSRGAHDFARISGERLRVKQYEVDASKFPGLPFRVARYEVTAGAPKALPIIISGSVGAAQPASAQARNQMSKGRNHHVPCQGRCASPCRGR